MATTKVVNAQGVLPPYLLRKVQEKLDGKGMLLYVPALEGWYEPPYHLQMVDDLTRRGWSAADIAAQLDITPRHVHRLRQVARQHPERLQARRPSTVAEHEHPTGTRPAPAKSTQRPHQHPSPQPSSPVQVISTAPGSPAQPTEILRVPQVTFVNIERTDW